jgi:hypothetical protein
MEMEAFFEGLRSSLKGCLVAEKYATDLQNPSEQVFKEDDMLKIVIR